METGPQDAGVVPDAELVRLISGRAAGTARDAEAELCRRFAPRVRWYGLRHLRDRDAAEDLVQHVLLMTLERVRGGQLREPERLASFVLGMSRMAARDLRRLAGRRRQLLERYGRDLERSSGEPAPPSVDTKRLELCLGGLSERERAVILLSFYAETPAEAIGRELGLSPGNVRVIRHRAVARLRACLAGGAAA